MLFIEYPRCSTCKKAKKFLDDNEIDYIDRDIVLDNPSYDELKKWVSTYNIEIKRLFNTSGIKYRELGLKDKISIMSDEDKLQLLASDGMLVKRPLLLDDKIILIGFKEKEWSYLK